VQTCSVTLKSLMKWSMYNIMEIVCAVTGDRPYGVIDGIPLCRACFDAYDPEIGLAALGVESEPEVVEVVEEDDTPEVEDEATDWE